MKQRLGIAGALLPDPSLLVLDEPANGLDPAGIREIRELLRRLAAERQMSIFISSHLLAEIELTCDRVAIIHKGRILRSGSVRELISSRREMELRVDDVARAGAIVAARNLQFHTDTDRIWVAIEEADAPPLLAALIQSGVNVFHAQRRTQSLEDMFLEATGGETVD
jgi:ABC-2 type transport system ATP-binding protein